MRARHLIATFLVIQTILFCSGPASAGAQSVTITATAQTLCGDSVVQPPEQCDGVNLNGATCASLGYSGGTLSCASNCVFVTDQCISPPGGGGGGGGGNNYHIPFSMPDLQTSVIFSGRAYPFVTVVISEGSDIKTSVNANAEATFQATLGTTPGLHTFTLYGVDSNGRRFPPQTFTVTAGPNIVTFVSGIFLPPTINLDKSVVKKGGQLGIFGLTASRSTVFVYIDLNIESSASITSGRDGKYNLLLNTGTLDLGLHTVRSQAVDISDGKTSNFSDTPGFRVGVEDVFQKLIGDLNFDGRVDIADMSILLYWWNTTDAQGILLADLNLDSKVDLPDLSIMLFYWTK